MDTLTIIKNKITELDSLYKRMDKTRDRVYNEPYTMYQLDGKTKLDNVINVTMPYGAIIANTVINDLMESYRQVVVKGQISATQKSKIENFVDDSRVEADERLVNSNWHANLFEIWCNHVCVRSFIGVRWITRIINGEYVIDCLPIDMRYCPFEYGNDGLNWVCNITYRSGGQVLAEYPEAADKGVKGDEIDLVICDNWTGDKNEVYLGGKDTLDVGGQLIRTQENPFGYPPFVIVAPATGFMLRDKKYIEHESEDILYLIRDILDEINRSVSIEQTLGYELIRPPRQYDVDASRMDGKPAPAPPTTGETKKAIKGEGWKLLDRPDVNNAFLTGRQDIQKVIQMGGVNDIDLGNVSQTVSAVWITAQSGIRKKFSNPRLKTIAQGEQQLARMIIDQYRKGVELEEGSPEILIGKRGQKRTYKADNLGDPDKYDITYEYRTQSKTEEIANLTQFEAAPDLPMEWKLEHILKVDDPKGIIRLMDWETAKRTDRIVLLSELGISLAREAEDMEDEQEADLKKLQSKVLIRQAVMMLKQSLQPAPEAPQSAPEERKGGTQALMSLPKLLGQGGGAIRQPKEIEGG